MPPMYGDLHMCGVNQKCMMLNTSRLYSIINMADLPMISTCNLHRLPRITLFQPHLCISQETVWTNIHAGQPVPSIGFIGLYRIYKLAINQSNLSKLGLC